MINNFRHKNRCENKPGHQRLPSEVWKITESIFADLSELLILCRFPFLRSSRLFIRLKLNTHYYLGRGEGYRRGDVYGVFRETVAFYLFDYNLKGESPHFWQLWEVELSGHGQPLVWGDATQGHIGSFVIIGPQPRSRAKLHFGNGCEQLWR